MYEIIRKKRDGGELSREEIYKFIIGYTENKIPDYQAAALLMAIYFNGMTEEETSALTEAMVKSGETLDLSSLGKFSADKHSTGGVGDKTSLVTAPIAAVLGCKVAKLSGRGLGHTGGTADKLESIPSYNAVISSEKLVLQTEKIGIAIATQSSNLALADKKLYALRDVTATVNSIPLIASSIMSKKIAAGSQNIVLDVKMGSGAFVKDIENARKLARCMVDIGKSAGKRVRAIITNMDIPLGSAVGNSLEVIEAIETLKGKGDKNFLDICVLLAAHMASMALDIEIEDALARAYRAVEDGSALQKFREWIALQGGDCRVIDDYSVFKKAAAQKEVAAQKTGYISKMDAEKIGSICVNLGGGRKTKEDEIDHAAGIILVKKTGDFVKEGETVARLYTNKENVTEVAEKEFLQALEISDTEPLQLPIVYEIVK